jgi:hypothetical protein
MARHVKFLKAGDKITVCTAEWNTANENNEERDAVERKPHEMKFCPVNNGRKVSEPLHGVLPALSLPDHF